MLTPLSHSMFRLFLLTLCAGLLSVDALAQHGSSSWAQSFELRKVFIENRSQFDGLNEDKGQVLFAVDHGKTKILFGLNGITYRFTEIKKKYEEEFEYEHGFDREDEEEWEREHEEWKSLSHEEREKREREVVSTTDFVHVKWENINPNARLVPEEKLPDYFNYSVGKSSVDGVAAFERLRYKDLYEGVDVIFEFHPEEGLKYSLELKPYADVSAISMKYSSSDNIRLDGQGDLRLSTVFGDIVEHAPVAFYSDNYEGIGSSFILNGSNVGFATADYDHSRPVTIDPWVQTPTLPNSNGVWECEVDAAGNVYVIGGEVPLKLLKYSSAGALQWTFTTAYDTTNGWLGGLATDNAGNSFVSNGSDAALQKVSAAGSQIFSVGGGGTNEYWSITLNCDESKLLIGGTINLLEAGLFDVSPSNGSVLNTRAVAATTLGIPPEPEEVRSLSPSRNSRYYYLTHTFVGAIDDGFSPCFNGEPIFYDETGYDFSYKCENYRPNNGNAPIVAIRANENFVYTVNGSQVHKRSLINGVVLGSASIPGGGTLTDFFGAKQAENAGIDLDVCGNVYVGSKNGVYKFDADLNLITSASTSFRVSDVTVNYNGEVVVCGTTGTDADVNRTGYVQSFNLGSCDPQELICCDPNICPAGPFCESDSPVTLTAGDPGGVWAGNGITNSSTGVFDPAVAGPGIHAISYTLPCGADSIYITVSPCQPLEVCLESNGHLTVLNGVATHTWYFEEQVQDCSTCFPAAPPFIQPCSTPPGCAVMVSGWTQFATGVTVTPPSYPIRVVDATGEELIITDPNSLPPCTECELPTVSFVAQDPLCENGNDGSIDLTVTGPSTYSFAWDNSATTEDINNLAAGDYEVTITDQADQTCDTVFTVTLNDGNYPVINGITVTGSTCGNADGQIDVTSSTATQFSADGGTSFQPNGSFTGLAAGSYSIVVEDVNGCQADSTVSVNNANGPAIDNLIYTDPNCGTNDGSIDITASGGVAPLSYSIDNGITLQPTGSFTGLAAGTYDVVIEDANGCQVFDQVVLSSSGGPSLDNVATVEPSCGLTNGQIDVTASGGTPPLQYSIDNGTTFQPTGTFTGLAPGTYDVVVDDGQGCPATQQVTLSSVGGATIDNVTVTDATCGQADGQLDITASGGTAPLQYSTDNGLTFQSSPQFTGLLAGNYELVVEDASGCQTTQSASVANSGAPTIGSITWTDALCKGDCDGTVDVIASGATQYSIDNGITFQGTGAFTGVCPGTYDVVVDDGAGCQAFGQVTVYEPTVVTLSSASTDATCSGSCDGTISITAGGGIPPYQYSIDNGVGFQQSANFTAVCDGSYSLVVEDANGCQVTGNQTVSVPNPITFSLVTTDVTCFNDCDGSATVTVAGGTPPYSYAWTGTAGASAIQSAICAGPITLVISDARNCSVDTAFTITQPALIDVENVIAVDEGCEGDCDGSIIIQASAANSFSIDGGETFSEVSDFFDVCPGGYSIIVLDTISGCGSTDTAVVAQGARVISDFTPIPEVVREFDSEVQFDNNSLGATAYEWHFGDENYSNEENPTYDFGNVPGTYLVCLVADNGLSCIDTSCKYVDVTPMFTIYVPNAFTPDASAGLNDVFMPVFSGERPETYHFEIFDRWGERIFSTDNPDVGWDGTVDNELVQKGVYVWSVQLEKEEGGNNRKLVGHVTVVR